MIPNRQIAEEAAEWAIRIDAGRLTLADRELLAQWLTASPVHVGELLTASSLLAGMPQLERGNSPPIEALLAEAAPEVIPLLGNERTGPGRDDRAPPAPSRSTPGRVLPVLAASLALVLTAALGILLSQAATGPASSEESAAIDVPGARPVSTGFGEQRSIVLEDGSIVHLNTDTRLSVALSGTQRRIDLLRGEALFEVAHDPSRPFRVYAGDTLTQALGTKFNVRRIGEVISIVVVEGKVLVNKRGSRRTLQEPGDPPAEAKSASPMLLVAGNQADLGEVVALPIIRPADIESATSWRLRKISFQDRSLDSIAQEFNRYNQKKIVVPDSRLGSRRLSGVFNADDPESFIAFLELSAGVTADRSQPERIVIRSTSR